MLSDPRKLRTAGGHGYLVGRRDLIRTDSEAEARALATRLLDEPGNEEALRAQRGLGESTSREELEEWLSTALAAGSMQLLRTKRRDRVLDTPKTTDLVDLLPDGKRIEDLVGTHWVSLGLVSADGRALRASYELVVDDAPVRRGYLGEEGRLREESLRDSAEARVVISDVTLPGGGQPSGEPPPLDPVVTGPQTDTDHFVSFRVERPDGTPVDARFQLTGASGPGEEIGSGALGATGEHRQDVPSEEGVVLSLELPLEA